VLEYGAMDRIDALVSAEGQGVWLGVRSLHNRSLDIVVTGHTVIQCTCLETDRRSKSDPDACMHVAANSQHSCRHQ